MLACNSDPLVHGWLWGTYSVTIWNLHAGFYYLWEFKTLRIFFSLRLIIDKMYIQLAQSCLSLDSTRKISIDMCDVGMFSMRATQNSTLPRGWFRRANTDRKSTRFSSNSGDSSVFFPTGWGHTTQFCLIGKSSKKWCEMGSWREKRSTTSIPECNSIFVRIRFYWWGTE